ncbi:hypothetical protein [Streptomyces sudanensis]|uniref:Uncharacterized protein n=2 Tax=Streptomyces TaxID=1883 RepID=A0ABY4TGR2_9ACTN|nr:hypothetical protein [Streptomyces sudanensis]URN17503.1 hypothetical protein MW084_17960 [Streptomyces sudanensis]
MTDRTTFVSLEGLRARGWTDGMVRDVLGQPDVQGRSPRRGVGAPVRLYLLARVEAVERAREFGVCARAGGASGSAGVRVAAESRRRAVLASLRAEPIRVPILPPAELERRAVRYRRRTGGAGADDGPGGDLARWQVGYLRGALRSYDTLLDGLFAGSGRAEAERLLRQRVYAAIAQAYPRLAEECRRQLGRDR